jgi:ribose transport system permease protein
VNKIASVLSNPRTPAGGARPTARLISKRNTALRRLLGRREVIVLVLLLVIVVFLQIASGGLFLSARNLDIMADRKSPEAMVTIGITFLLIANQFDLSVASVMASCGAATAWLLVHGASIPVAILAGLLVGALLGALNGLLVTRLRIPSFITTLGTMYIARSSAQIITSGRPIGGLPPVFNELGKIRLFGLPWYFLLLLVAITLLTLLLKKQKGLYKLFFMGTNERASFMVGINSNRITWYLFIISGLIAAFAGIILTSKSYSASPIAFDKMEMRYIAACVIGGASIRGGSGSILGSLLGFLLIVLIGNGMTLIGISPYWENVIFGCILAIAAIADAWSVTRRTAT